MKGARKMFFVRGRKTWLGVKKDEMVRNLSRRVHLMKVRDMERTCLVSHIFVYVEICVKEKPELILIHCPPFWESRPGGRIAQITRLEYVLLPLLHPYRLFMQ